MGSGLSSAPHHPRNSPRQPPPVLVVAADGSLRELAPAPSSSSCSSSPVSASDALAAAANAGAGRSFLCSADALYFDADVPALAADEPLRPGQIYFVLPAHMLARPLSSADMAALAVRASDAMAARARAGRARARAGFARARVVPAPHADAEEEAYEKLNQRTLGGFETAAPSPARKPAVAARPPVRRALSTIEEDAE